MTRLETVDTPAVQAAFDRTGPSVSGLCRLFWEIEEKYNLPAFRIAEVYVWPLVRMNLYYELTQKIGLFGAAHPALKHSGKGKKSRGFSAGALFQRELPLKAVVLRDRLGKRNRYAVVGNGRRIAGIEPYTEALLKEIGDQSLLIEPQADDSAYENVWDYQELTRSFRSTKKKRKAISDPQLSEMANALTAEFETRLGIEAPDIAEILSRAIWNFREEREGFGRLFKKNHTKKLFLLNAYSRPACIAAARDLDCSVVELQHGFISRYHLGYSWPGRPHIAYTPDELWCFGPAWCRSLDLPAGVTTRSIGAPYLEPFIEAADTAKTLVVFTSQGVVGKRLLSIAIEVANRRPALNIVFRLHPNEILESYRAEIEAREDIPSNFSLSHKDPSIFDLLSRARFQIGSFSTTLIEGMAVGAFPIVLSMPGCEYMEEVVQSGDARFASSLEDVLAALDSGAGNSAFRDYYAIPSDKLI